MQDKRVVIIGAGLAGLATGIYAQMNGFQSRIFEHAPRPGGVAATWKRRGYTIDGGIHFYMGFRPGQPMHTLYQELGIDQADQYREMDIYERFVDAAQNVCIDLTRDLNHLRADLKTIAPQDSKFIDTFISAIRPYQGVDFLGSIAKPPELTGFLDTVRMLWKMRKTMRYYSGAHARPVNNYTHNVKSRVLKEFLEHIFLPDVPVWFVLFTMGMFFSGNMALRRDGSAGFVQALEKRYLSLGGQVSYRSRVARILIRNDTATGVALENNDEEHADLIVAAGDAHTTIFDLLEGQYVNDDIDKRFKEWPLFPTVVLVNYGVAREFIKDPWMVVMKAPRPIAKGFVTDDWMPVRIFNYGDGFAPQGKTVVQVMLTSQWNPWHTLRSNETAYMKEKETLTAEVLENLCQYWPGLDKDVEMTNVATPFTWWRYTLNRRGAFEGFAVTDKAIKTRILRTLPGLENLFLAGQWNTPGGGVIPSLMTGKHAVMLMCKKIGSVFRVVGSDREKTLN